MRSFVVRRAMYWMWLPGLLVACAADPASDEPGADDAGGGADAASDAGHTGGSSSGTSGTSGGSSGGFSGEPSSSSGGSSGEPSSSSGGSSGGSSSGEPAPTDDDGIHNGDETDIDCGGPSAANRCEPGQGCLEGSDCSQRVCTDAVCAEARGDDGVQNGDETGADCGGPTVPQRCAPGLGCVAAGDCAEGVCNQATGLCAVPSFGDGVKNGTETGIDCGGPDAPNRCEPGQGCSVASDCAEHVCTLQTELCAAPRDDDGVRNGDETDVDCGGPTTPNRCATGKVCGAHADCASDGCAYDGRCAESRSCTAHEGGDTCGTGELYQANRQHESCCRTLPVVASNNVKLDKYNITAGRMRAFVERTGGNIQGWIANAANKPAWWNDDWTTYLPTGLNTPVRDVQGTMRNLGVYGQLGPNFVYNQDGLFGCWSGAAAGQAGAPTYFIPTAERQAQNANDAGSLYPQSLLDQKAISCVNYIMVAAFCAWDGGRVPTIDELDRAWDGGTPASRFYPWGNAPVPAGYDSGYPAAGSHTPAAGNPLLANFHKNYPQTGADWVAQGNLRGNDLAFYIAPPGRFPEGAGPYGHMDLGGGVFNVTSTLSGNTASTLTTSSRWSRSGSWETAHGIPYPTHTSPLLRKYWAQGGRCVKN